MPLLFPLLALFALFACSGVDKAPVEAPPDSEAPLDTCPADADALGYAIHGEGWFPPLRHRVHARPCPTPPYGENECTTDEDCGQGFACVCDEYAASVCVPAECHQDADCASGLCLVSPGGYDDGCGERCPSGLYCERPNSTCEAESWCPGNGTWCAYVAERDRFECSNAACRCD